MKIKAVCPNNPEHKRFVTTAHVVQDWVVDENGNFISCRDAAVETTHGPDPENVWVCLECGEEAEVKIIDD